MLKKSYLKSKPECKVTFRLPKSYVGDTNRICLAGEFNNWDHEATPMTKLKNGDFKIDLKLENGQEYHFRYKVNDEYWINDDQADHYRPSPFPGVDNSVVAV